MQDSRRRYSTFAKSLIIGIQMISSVLMAVCAVILTEYINQKLFYRHQARALFPWAKQSVWMLTVFGIIWLFCLCYMTVAAGKRAEDREIHLNKFDELRTELQLLLLAGTMGVLLFLAMQIHRQNYQMMGRMIMAGTFALLAHLCFMGIYLSLVRKIKTETFTANSFLGTLLSNLRQNIRNPYLKTGSAQKKKLLEGLERITQGDLDYKLDLREFHGTDMQLAEGINHIGEGLNRAVNERVQDERTKANMITNISHDLKTPLTSIINYIGLIRREEIGNDRVEGYVDVLEQKALRLKQLMEDLTEVSRISSGNVSLQMANIDLVELVCQTGGEFNEKLEQKELSVITKLPRESVMIFADGRQLWRVLGNLYSNAAKYAMPKSRIYVEVEKKNGLASFSMKNITETPLSVEAEELTERFVRGDESRSTEGSGLGLSISKMLTELMGGRFDVSTEDDLFRVRVTFRCENCEMSETAET